MEKIRKNKRFIRNDILFNELLDQIKLGPISIKEWSKKLGYASPYNLKIYLTSQNIKFSINDQKRRYKSFKDREIKRVIKLYAIGFFIIDIAKVFKTDPTVIKKILVSNNITIRKATISTQDRLEQGIKIVSKSYKNCIAKLNEMGVVYETMNSEHRGTMLKCKCQQCNKGTVYERKDLMDRIESLKTEKFLCQTCYSKIIYPDLISSLPIKSNNTTGYIGISYIVKQNGYSVELVYKKAKILSKWFRCEINPNKTLMEAVVEREKFIIRNGLPHTRNLTDDELFSNMEMLGQYSDLGLIKEDLKEYYTILKLDKGV